MDRRLVNDLSGIDTFQPGRTNSQWYNSIFASTVIHPPKLILFLNFFLIKFKLELLFFIFYKPTSSAPEFGQKEKFWLKLDPIRSNAARLITY